MVGTGTAAEGRSMGGPTGRPVVRVAAGGGPELLATLHRLDRGAGIEVVGTAGDGRGLVALYRSLLAAGEPPDVVVTGHAGPGLDAAETTQWLRGLDPDATVVVLCARADLVFVGECLRAGVAGCVLESTPPEELAERVRQAARGTPVFDRQTAGLVMAAARQRSSPHRTQLSPREAEVLSLVAEKRTNGDIAERLSISRETVKTHLERIFHKLGVSDRAAAVRRGFEDGIL